MFVSSSFVQAYADLISDCAKVKELEFAYAGCDEGEDEDDATDQG